jgi:hypothetical protein
MLFGYRSLGRSLDAATSLCSSKKEHKPCNQPNCIHFGRMILGSGEREEGIFNKKKVNFVVLFAESNTADVCLSECKRFRRPDMFCQK